MGGSTKLRNKTLAGIFYTIVHDLDEHIIAEARAELECHGKSRYLRQVQGIYCWAHDNGFDTIEERACTIIKAILQKKEKVQDNRNFMRRNICNGLLLIILVVGLLAILTLDILTRELFYGPITTLDEILLLESTFLTWIGRTLVLIMSAYGMAYGVSLFFDHELLIDEEEED